MFIPKKSGAYTGEISIDMIKACGCVYTIIGHSERRNIFKESDELIGKKVEAAYTGGGVTPILCVGENLDIRKQNGQERFVENQLSAGFNHIDRNFAGICPAFFEINILRR